MDPALREQALASSWYHTLELAPDLITDGWFDLRHHVPLYGLPERMDGMRALEIGTWDGFWAFEMERRGATVIALDLDDEKDLDWPPRRRPATFENPPRGNGFRLAKQILDSKVERVNTSIYHATPEELGTFDIVFCGSVLIHLRDQLLALERIANLTTNLFISAEEYDPLLTALRAPVSRYRADRDSAVVFWLPSITTWKKLFWTAGFNTVEEKTRFKMNAKEFDVRHVVLHGRK